MSRVGWLLGFGFRRTVASHRRSFIYVMTLPDGQDGGESGG